MFQIRIRTNDDAFEEDEMFKQEIARILKDIRIQVLTWTGYDKWQTILDDNGNNVGSWKISKGKE